MERDMRSRLRRAFRADDERADVPGAAPAAVRGGRGLRDYLQRRASKQGVLAARGRELDGGATIENESGTCWALVRRYGATHRHGVVAVADALRVDWRNIAECARDDRFAESSLERCLFLDTETTGLAGGAGTVVFMTGLGFFDGSEFVVEQVMLRAFGEEPAALRHVANRLRERPLIVSYVGKTFDRHRLAARMSLFGIGSPILEAEHLDLYYLARRSWAHRLHDVRLQTVERSLLGLHREDDLPGRDAPRAFLDWLRDGSGPVERVLEHNRLDVLSLVTLLARLGSPPAQSRSEPGA